MNEYTFVLVWPVIGLVALGMLYCSGLPPRKLKVPWSLVVVGGVFSVMVVAVYLIARDSVDNREDNVVEEDDS